MRKPLGHGEVVSLGLAEIQEQIRAQHGLITGQHRFLEGLFAIETVEYQSLEPLHRLLLRRASCRRQLETGAAGGRPLAWARPVTETPQAHRKGPGGSEEAT